MIIFFGKFFNRWLHGVLWVLFLVPSAYGASSQSVEELDHAMSITVDFLILHGEDQESIAEILDSQLYDAEKLHLLFVLTSQLYQSSEDQRFVWISLLSEFEHYEVTGPIWDAVKEFIKEDVVEPFADIVREAFTSDNGGDDGRPGSIQRTIECDEDAIYSGSVTMDCKGSIDDRHCIYEASTTIQGGCTVKEKVTMPRSTDPSSLDDVPHGPVPPPLPSQSDLGGDGASHEDIMRNRIMDHSSAF